MRVDQHDGVMKPPCLVPRAYFAFFAQRASMGALPRKKSRKLLLLDLNRRKGGQVLKGGERGGASLPQLFAAVHRLPSHMLAHYIGCQLGRGVENVLPEARVSVEQP